MKRLQLFFRNWRNWVGVLLVGFIGIVAIATPLIAPQEDPANPQYLQQVGRSTDNIPHPPSQKALLGTLPHQYDVFFSLLWGLRQAFQFGLSVTLAAAGFGIIYGATSAYVGGMASNVMMRIADAFLTFPILAAVVFMKQILVLLLEKTGILINAYFVYPEIFTPLQSFLMNADPVLWALVLFSWMPYARLVNASVVRLRNIDYVMSARALGASHSRIILRHLLPNVISPEIVMAARDIGAMVILQATFTFIGLGGTSPWGQVLAEARDWIVGPGGNPFRYWWTYLPITFAIILFGVSWNFVGDSLNDWFNPRKVS